ncbi:MAG: CDP-alcohol phosphatidyltransferase family protein [Acidimicrobiia bacterium]|nr:CDP-alcohol phosphatidyltransferase family protein [Acidimicrobiia bacterium]
MSATSRPDADPEKGGIGDLLTREQILTWPNLFTLVRLLCIPVFVWLLFGREHRAAAAWLLGALGSTDWVDGWLARRFDQSSDFGAIFDPTVDRLLFFVAVPSLIVDGSIPIVVALLALGRELVTAALALLAEFRLDHRILVTREGKTGAFLMMFAVPMYLGAESTLSYAPILAWLAWLFAVPGLVYGWYSTLGQYLPLVRRLRQTPDQASPGNT